MILIVACDAPALRRPEGWEDGNILRMASLVTDQRWDYGYDGRSRLTSAIRANAGGVPQYRIEYAYDDGDNLLTKQTHVYDAIIADDFSDGDSSSTVTTTPGKTPSAAQNESARPSLASSGISISR